MINKLTRGESMKSKANQKPIVLGLAIVCVVTAGLMFPTCHCRPIGDSFQFHAVRGIVRDVETNIPIENAWVDDTDSIPPYSIFTDSIGRYEFVYLGTAIHDVHIYCSKEGYLTLDTVVTIPTNASLGDTLDIYLLRE